jgi:DNA-binding beta-propeller fold protein YncE
VYRDVYEAANSGAHLGSTGDDIKLYHGRAYMLMSHSENLVVISLENHLFLQSKTFSGSTPHDILIDSVRNRAYVSRLFKSSIYVVELTTLNVIDSVAVGENPQGMIVSNGDLYVCNSGFGEDRTVTVVDLNVDTVRTVIRVGDGPTNAAVAPDGKIWVACTGISYPPPTTPGKVFVINPSSRAVVDSIVFTENLGGAISIGSAYAFVIGQSGLHRINLATKSVTLGFISGSFYALGVDGPSGDIYLTDARTFDVDGELQIYSSNGILKKRHFVQMLPGAIAFKH